jgi:Xaa-Pro dipeptidase
MTAAIAEAPFSPEEMAARLARVRRGMDAGGIDALIVLAPDSQYWLCGLESFISGVLSQALIVPADGERSMVLVVWDADAPLARATAIVEQIYGYRFGVDDPVAAFCTALDVCAPSAEVVGFDAASRAVPHALGVRLVAALAPVRCVDCSTLLAEARLVKSENELALLRRAGAFAEAGLQAALEHARPGITERRLAAEIEYAMRSAGSDYPSIPTELTSGRRSALVHGTPSHRTLEAGDLVHVEVGGVEQRYNAVGLQTVHIGGAPPRPPAFAFTRLRKPACARASTRSTPVSRLVLSRHPRSPFCATPASATASRCGSATASAPAIRRPGSTRSRSHVPPSRSCSLASRSYSTPACSTTPPRSASSSVALSP